MNLLERIEELIREAEQKDGQPSGYYATKIEIGEEHLIALVREIGEGNLVVPVNGKKRLVRYRVVPGGEISIDRAVMD